MAVEDVRSARLGVPQVSNEVSCAMVVDYNESGAKAGGVVRVHDG